MERVLQFLPDGSGYHWCVAQAHWIVRAWILRIACVWMMERVLQLPPLRFGLPLMVSEVAVGHAMVTRCVSEEAAE